MLLEAYSQLELSVICSFVSCCTALGGYQLVDMYGGMAEYFV